MLTQKLVLSYTIKITIQVLTMLAGIIVARVAGPTIIGTVAFDMAFVTMFTFICELGVTSAHVKLISEGKPLGDCIKTFSVIKSALIAFFVMIVLLYLVIEKLLLHTEFTDPVHVYVILIWLIAVSVTQFMYIPINTFMALTQQAKQDIPGIVQAVITVGLRIAVVLVAASAVALSMANLIGTLVIVPIYLYLFRNMPKGKFDPKLAREYFRIAKALVLIDIFVIITSQLDKVLLQYFTDSQQVGYFTAGFSIANLIQFIAMAAGMLLFPVFSAAVAQNDFRSIDLTIEKYERFIFLFVMPVVVIMMIYSDMIISFLLGGAYQPSGHVLMFTMMGAFFTVASQPYGNLLVGANCFYECAYANFLGMLAYLFLNMVLVGPWWFNLKALGTALTYAINTLLLGLSFRFYVGRKVKVIPVWRNKKFWVLGVALFLVFYSLARLLNIQQNLIALFIFPVGYFFLTYAWLFMTRWIRRDDLQMIKQIFNIRSMATYIRSELKT